MNGQRNRDQVDVELNRSITTGGKELVRRSTVNRDLTGHKIE